MKLVGLIFALMLFTTVKALIILENSPDALVFPTLELPDVEFAELPTGCSGLFSGSECLELIAKILYNAFLAVGFAVATVIVTGLFLLELFAVIIEISFTGFSGAPAWVNALTTTVLGALIAIKLYVMVRTGGEE